MPQKNFRKGLQIRIWLLFLYRSAYLNLVLVYGKGLNANRFASHQEGLGQGKVAKMLPAELWSLPPCFPEPLTKCQVYVSAP
jgi:hypothetical protein